MASYPAPCFVNLVLCYHEKKWIKKIKITDIKMARKPVNSFSFTDDLTVLNDGGKFERNSPEIYPPQLKLQTENDVNTEGSF